jgi:p-cumate 2,3-dioxygenase ferredoxin subunit
MSQELHRLCAVADIDEGGIKGGTLADGHAVAIYKVDGEIYVTDDLCSHGEASLSEEGSLDGCRVECSWHFGSFDVRTGQPVASPCVEPIGTYRVVIDGDSVFVAPRPVVAIKVAGG